MNVAFLGLGIMGSRMAVHLVRAGHHVVVWNRTAATAASWASEYGGEAAGTAADAGRDADVVVTMVVDGPQVEEVLLGEHGAARHAPEGTLFVDMSTIAPSDSRRIAARLGERGMRFLDAPVTGSSPKAADGTLTIMVGGEVPDLDRARPLLDAMGSRVVHAGPTGHGSMVKLLNNTMAAINTLTVAQALVAGAATGVDLDALVEVAGSGSGGSLVLDLKAGPMREHDYTTLFKLDHMLKDVRLCLEECQAAGVPFPLAGLARDALVAGRGRGFGEADFAALLEAVEGAAGVRL